MPDELIDKSLITGSYAPYIYVFCIILRIILGYLVLYKSVSNLFVYVLSILVIIIFSKKLYYFRKNNIKTWKHYERTIGLYSITVLITYFNKLDYNLAGLIIMTDALFGIRSRIIAENIKI